jgi:hypothetical protein
MWKAIGTWRKHIAVFGFELTDEAMQRLRTLDTGVLSVCFNNLNEEPDFTSFRRSLDFND